MNTFRTCDIERSGGASWVDQVLFDRLNQELGGVLFGYRQSAELIVQAYLEQFGNEFMEAERLSHSSPEKAPMLVDPLTRESCVLPDFLTMSRADQLEFIEAKWTERPMRNFGIALHQYLSYSRVRHITGIPVVVILVAEATGWAFIHEVPEVCGDLFVRDNVVYLPRSELRAWNPLDRLTEAYQEAWRRGRWRKPESVADQQIEENRATKFRGWLRICIDFQLSVRKRAWRELNQTPTPKR